MVPFYGWYWTASRLELFCEGSLLFTTKFPEISGIHFTNLGSMKNLSRTWSHPLVLNTKSQDWEFITLTTIYHSTFEIDHQQRAESFLFLDQRKKILKVFFSVWFCRAHKHLEMLTLHIIHWFVSLKLESSLSKTNLIIRMMSKENTAFVML